MTKEAVAEANVEQAVPEQEVKMVPLEALEAERRKRQSAEAERNWANEQAQSRQKQDEPQEEEDDEYTREITQKVELRLHQKQRAQSETEWIANNPEAVERMKREWPQLKKRKPYLEQSVDNAPNRYARAWEILQDYTPPPQASSEADRRVEENKKVPGNPAGAAKAVTPKNPGEGMSRAEFSRWRAVNRGVQPNIR